MVWLTALRYWLSVYLCTGSVFVQFTKSSQALLAFAGSLFDGCGTKRFFSECSAVDAGRDTACFVESFKFIANLRRKGITVKGFILRGFLG